MLWITLAGCSPMIEGLVVEPGAVPGVVRVSWTSREPGVGTVVATGDAGTHKRKSKSGTDHVVSLIGLKTGQTYTVGVDFETDTGKTRTFVPMEVTVDPPGQGAPIFTVTTHDPTKTCADDGHVMFSWLGDKASGVGILDRDADYVWSHLSDVPETTINRVRPGRDGQSLLYLRTHGPRTEDVATITRLSMDGEERIETRALQGHHDFVELQDGRLAWLGYEFTDVDIRGDIPDAGVIPVVADAVFTAEEGVADSTTTERLWSFFDHVSSDVCDIRGDPGTLTGFLPGFYEYSHGNSLVLNETDHSLYVMSRWLDTLFHMSDDGSPIWQWGELPCGEEGDIAVDPEDDFVHAHFSEAWDDQLLIFDNHDNRFDDPPSMLKQFTVDAAAGTAERTWQYDGDRTEKVLGDVRRIPLEGCDNLIVAFSGQGRIAEMTRDGQIVWEASNNLGQAVARITYVPDLYDMTGTAYPE